MREIWLPVPGYEGLYEVSSLGQVRSLDRVVQQVGNGGGTISRLYKGRLLRPSWASGYAQVALYRDGKTLHRRSHSLVCAAFHGPKPTPKHEAAHWDGDPTNNSESNLRWATKLENAEDKRRHGTVQRGSGHAHAVLNDAQVTEVFTRYWRLTEGRTKRPPYGSVIGIAREYGVGRSVIESIIYFRWWTHLTEPLTREFADA